MFYLKKQMEISGAHSLELFYDSPCRCIHGHNWIITVYCKCEDQELNENGIMVDFSEIKKIVHQLDHDYINNILRDQGENPINPTAENIAFWLYQRIPFCYRVDVEETKNNVVSYVEEE